VSDTNPLPAAQLMALADAMASAVGSHVICDAGLEGSHMERTLEAYRAARAASQVTQSVTLDDMANTVCRDIPDGYEVQLCMENGAGYVTLTTKDGQYASLPDSADKGLEEQINDALEVAKEHARRLAGEGGGK